MLSNLMNVGGFDIGKITGQRWFQVTHGVALIVSLVLPWAIVDDHSASVSAFALLNSLWSELDHHTEAATGLVLLIIIIPMSAIHLYIKLGGGRGLWPAWTLTITALMLPLLAGDAMAVRWGYAGMLLLSAPAPAIWCVNKARSPRLDAVWAKLKGATRRGSSSSQQP